MLLGAAPEGQGGAWGAGGSEPLASTAEASITVAIPGMVEVLPQGCSKASGVSRALELMDLRPAEVLALGDGENDLEMMELIRSAGGITVAMGNARPKLLEAAEFRVSSCDEARLSLYRSICRCGRCVLM